MEFYVITNDKQVSTKYSNELLSSSPDDRHPPTQTCIKYKHSINNIVYTIYMQTAHGPTHTAHTSNFKSILCYDNKFIPNSVIVTKIVQYHGR